MDATARRVHAADTPAPPKGSAFARMSRWVTLWFVTRAVDADDPRPRRRRLLAKPTWFEALEVRIAQRVPVHPNVLSCAKLVLVLPPLVLALRQISVLPASTGRTVALLVAFFALDWLDGVVARHRGLETRFGRIFDRLTDLP
ncbi:MAG TPA: CDP-alcohol phosphatidyltransferase family protein, partial [Nannocystaceae bacterium]|nr:CDP-alcohol phosphatidyltransferase family protein [Nannocystaceae bacterium]